MPGTSGERAFGAPAGCIRAGPYPSPLWDRADSGPLAAFSSLPSIGMITRSIPPRSSRRNAPRGPNRRRQRSELKPHPKEEAMSHALAAVLRRARRARANSSRSRNLRFAAIPRGAVLSCYPRGRRGGYAAHAAVAAGLCCGPRYAAIWRPQARTSSRRLAALATRPSATAPRRLGLPGGGCKLGDGKTEIRNFVGRVDRASSIEHPASGIDRLDGRFSRVVDRECDRFANPNRFIHV